mmetsp:Transcript_33286/g.112977  ORF Transcript_33286/g.112977 Transcript_33286/m.112977 type:complete len:228 (+) Transcript_33286:394-1077(+)
MGRRRATQYVGRGGRTPIVRRRAQRLSDDAPRHGRAPLRSASRQPPAHQGRPALHPRLRHVPRSALRPPAVAVGVHRGPERGRVRARPRRPREIGLRAGGQDRRPAVLGAHLRHLDDAQARGGGRRAQGRHAAHGPAEQGEVRGRARRVRRPGFARGDEEAAGALPGRLEEEPGRGRDGADLVDDRGHHVEDRGAPTAKCQRLRHSGIFSLHVPRVRDAGRHRPVLR